MSNYLPELRESLVEAARLERASRETPDEAIVQPSSGRRRRSRLGAIATALASAAAIAVLVIALMVAGRRDHAASRPSKHDVSPAAHVAAVRAAAGQILDRFAVPPGAVESSSDPSAPARLGAPDDMLPLPGMVAVHRFWSVAGTVGDIGRWIERHPPAGGELQATSGLTSGRGRSRKVVEWVGVFVFPPARPSATVRQLAVQVAPAARGVAVRADGEAGWIAPRPVAEQVPAGITRIVVTNATTSGHHGPGAPSSSGHIRFESESMTSPPQVGRLVMLLNVLRPLNHRPRRCGRTPLAQTGLTLYASGRGRARAKAVVDYSCGAVTLTIAGRPTQTLAIDRPGLDGALSSALGGRFKGL